MTGNSALSRAFYDSNLIDETFNDAYHKSGAHSDTIQYNNFVGRIETLKYQNDNSSPNCSRQRYYNDFDKYPGKDMDYFSQLSWEERKMTNELIKAIHGNHISKIRNILDMNPDTIYYRNKNGVSSISAAAKEGNVYIMEILFSHLSDTQESNKLGNQRKRNISEIIEDRDNNNRTALHVACRWGRDEAVDFLLDNNASLYARDCVGDTPMHLAVRFRHVECVKNMLVHYPDCLLPNNSGITPLDEIKVNDCDNYRNLDYLHGLVTKYLQEDYFIYIKDVLDFESTSEVSRLHSLPECLIDVIVTFVSGVAEESTSEASVKHLRKELESTRDFRKKDSLGVSEKYISW